MSEYKYREVVYLSPIKTFRTLGNYYKKGKMYKAYSPPFRESVNGKRVFMGDFYWVLREGVVVDHIKIFDSRIRVVDAFSFNLNEILNERESIWRRGCLKDLILSFKNSITYLKNKMKGDPQNKHKHKHF